NKSGYAKKVPPKISSEVLSYLKTREYYFSSLRILTVSSNSAATSSVTPLSCVILLTMIAASVETMTPGIISYTSMTKVPAAIQMITVAAPLTIAAIAPERVIPFQCRDSTTRGPNAAPNPAHAFATMLRITDSSSHAMRMATSATKTTDSLPMRTNSLSSSSSDFVSFPITLARINL